MTAALAIAGFTLRGLMGRRRAILIVLLAGLPVLVSVIIRLAGGTRDVDAVLQNMVIRAVMPLVALIVGTAAVGSEIEDGTIVYLLTKPVPRWLTALAKLVVAAGLTAILVVPSVVISGLIMGGSVSGADVTGAVTAYAIACLAGGVAYACAFTTLGIVTGRALIVGLVYTLIWEGVIAGLLDGTRFLSIRQATLAVGAGLRDVVDEELLDPAVGAAILAIVIVGSFALATVAMRRLGVRGGD